MTRPVPAVDLAAPASYPADDANRAANQILFRLPIEGWPRAVFRSSWRYEGGTLTMEGEPILCAASRDDLERGVEGALRDAPRTAVRMQLVSREGAPSLGVWVGEKAAPREGDVWARPTRSAWTHAFIALAGSAAGFAASLCYLVKAQALQSQWALKMGQHTAGWHLLLTFTLFPASVWGQRAGIRAVQLVSLLFFCIHAGIAIANSDLGDPAIAFFNALSGAFFLASVVYGNRAHRDMDPIAALVAGRV